MRMNLLGSFSFLIPSNRLRRVANE